MDDFWNEEEGSEWDKEAFEAYGKKPVKAKKNKSKYVFLVCGIAPATILAVVLGLVIGLSQH